MIQSLANVHTYVIALKAIVKQQVKSYKILQDLKIILKSTIRLVFSLSLNTLPVFP